MKHLAWMSVGILALAGLAPPCVAQVLPSRLWPCPPRVGAPCPPSTTKPATPDTTTTPPPSPETATPDFSGAGEFKGTTGRTSSVVAGTGLGGAVTGDPTVTTVFAPLILPGLFTTAMGQSALPANRVFFDYGYFNGVAVQGVGSSAPVLVQTVVTPPSSGGGGGGGGSFAPQAPSVPPPTVVSSVVQSPAFVSGFNLHTFNFGVEKTFLDGLASAYLSVPFLYATDNITGQDINGLGDINVGFKVILIQSLRTGNTLTGGFTVSCPSAHPAVSTSFAQSDNGNGATLLASSTTTVNQIGRAHV